jgi:DNA-binding CsgD family transcriptional regulator/PAS domain-containing protein
MDVERYSALVADIYDAALDPPLWHRVLKEVCEFVRGGPSASLFWQDPTQKKGRTYFVWGGDPRYAELYWKKYADLNPLAAAAITFPVGELYSGADVLPLAQFVETPFYREWMAPQGWGDVVSTNLDKSATSRAVFSVARHARDGLVDEEMRRRMRLLVPHVRRAVLVGKLIDLKRVEAAALADTLDGLDAGAFLVDAGGRLVHANASARDMLNEGNMLHANGKLLALEGASERALQDVFAAARKGDEQLAKEDIAVQLTARNGDQFVTHVLPLTSGARRRGAPYSAVAAVFVERAEREASNSLDSLAERYRLTPGELRVLIAIVDIGGVPEVADALKVSPTTVRSHLRRVFEKTGVSRQADLVKLVRKPALPRLTRNEHVIIAARD